MAGSIGVTAKTGIGVFALIKRYWYWIIVLIVLVPAIIGSIKTASETDNLSYPFVVLGLKMTNADALNYQLIQNLKENPEAVIGMAKPQSGFWLRLQYAWYYSKNVIWVLIGNFLIMFFPLVIIFKLFKRFGNESKNALNIVLSLLIWVFLIFFVNILILVDGLITGSEFITIPEGTDTYKRMLEIIKLIIPFKGVWAIVKYIYALFPST